MLGLWLISPEIESDRKSDWVLTGPVNAPSLTFRGEEREFSLATHPGELAGPMQTAQGT